MKRCLPKIWRSHTSLGEADIICRRQTSLKKDDCFRNRLFSWQGREDSVSALRRKAEFLISALLRSSVFRGSDSPPDCHSLPLPFEPSPNCIPAKRKSPRKIVDFIFLAGAGGLEPAPHGFGVAPKCRKALKLLTFSHVSTHFSH